MSVIFNADEIFDIAEEIERNGARFYRQAAEDAADREIKKMFLDMAVMEDGHLHTFEQMRKELVGEEGKQSVFDPDDEATTYLQIIADSHGTEGRLSPTRNLTGSETVEEIFNAAVNAEKDSIVFYVGLKNAAASKITKEKIEAIIKEEMGHLAILNQQLAILMGK